MFALLLPHARLTPRLAPSQVSWGPTLGYCVCDAGVSQLSPVTRAAGPIYHLCFYRLVAALSAGTAQRAVMWAVRHQCQLVGCSSTH
jgi:hypothetical protein